MPSASIASTWDGSLPPSMCALSPGIRLSRIRVVLPEPDTPVITDRRPFGKETSSGHTVWMAPVRMRRVPRSKRSALLGAGLSPLFRYGPMREAGLASNSPTVPCAMTVPPLAPASGPSSIMWSACASTCVSWSTSTTVLPSATKSSMTPVRPSRLNGCRPMEGSSST